MVQDDKWKWLLEGFNFDLATAVKPKTVEYYCDHARLFVRWTQRQGQVPDPELITKRDIQRFLLYLVETTEPSVVANGAVRHFHRTDRTRWHYYRCLKRFFSWAVAEGYVKHSPMDGIDLKPPKAPPIEPYSPEQVGLFLKVLDHRWQTASTARQKMLAARDMAVLFLFLESGLRLSELLALSTPDIDLERQRVLVREGKMGKGRLAGFGVQTKRSLWRYMGLRPSESQYLALWLTEEGRPITKHGLQEIIRGLKEDSGLQHVRGSVHKLRHTFATTYLRHTKDMKGCRILLGHSTLAMTERYTQFIDAEDALEAYDGKGPLDWMRDAKDRGRGG